ncbi:hypothetical protein Rhe02_20170 [Rhizocola hellebori]|uniref:Uncharacterized protein n=1 Tax=Rhizocola hellebori TaxID=1392758 RepID=A0A8J3Q6A7_9ACTN|nr:restriction endonuclease fold toxin-2 domain-containing protein [Rhizocola hellebori]GIH03950.1 hypothetical protein Rhe02_20170 [Rhizocola hellebori]
MSIDSAENMSYLPTPSLQSRQYTGGGFEADSDVLYTGSTKYLDVKNYLFAIAAGLAGDLAQTKGMAGDNTAAHQFARRYEPAATEVVKGIGKAGEAMAAIASRLLDMAFNYLYIEDEISRMFMQGVNAASPLAKSKVNCEPEESYRALEMVTGSRQVHDMWLIGEYWPEANVEKLRVAERVWKKVAELIDDAQRNAFKAEEIVTVNCDGPAIDAFEQFGKSLYTDFPSGATEVNDGRPILENLSAEARRLAEMCDNFAQHTESVRRQLIEIGVVIAVCTAAGIALTVFTLGGSDAAAAAADAAAVAEAAATVTALEAAVVTDTVAIAAAESVPVIEGQIIALAARGAAAETAATITQIAAGVTLVAGAGTLLTPSDAEAAALTPARDPIAPPLVMPPNLRMYSPLEAAEANTWAQTLPSRDPNYGTPEDRAYQLRVAGSPERLVTGANGTTIWADGFRPEDGALVDAKHVRQLDCSPRTLEGLTSNSFRTGLMLADDDNEMRKYAAGISNPDNHAQYVEIDTNDASTVGYWQFLAAKNHLPSNVRVVE